MKLKTFKQFITEKLMKTYVNGEWIMKDFKVPEDDKLSGTSATPDQIYSYIMSIHRPEDEETNLSERVSKFKKFTLKTIKIDTIDNANRVMQPFVKALAKKIQAGTEKVKPIVVYKDSGYYDIIDGSHRYEASKLAGLTTIQAWVGTK